MTKRREFKDGDIYFWQFKQVADPSTYGSYHCTSQKAVARNGVLYDTFWSSSDNPVPIKLVKLQFKGNKADLEKISSGLVNYYRPSDVVDMRHSNSSRAEVYIKRGAKKSKKLMLNEANYELKQLMNKILSANYDIGLINDAIKKIKAGELDNVHIPVSR